MSKAGPGTESPQAARRTRPESPWRDPVKIALMDACRPMALLALLPAALALKRRQRIRASLERNRQAILDDPGDAIARYRLGLALFHLDRLGEAIERFEEASRLDPDNRTLSKALRQACSRLEIALMPFE